MYYTSELFDSLKPTEIYMCQWSDHFDGLMQEMRISSAKAMGLRLSRTNPSICSGDVVVLPRRPSITWTNFVNLERTLIELTIIIQNCFFEKLHLKCLSINWNIGHFLQDPLCSRESNNYIHKHFQFWPVSIMGPITLFDGLCIHNTVMDYESKR